MTRRGSRLICTAERQGDYDRYRLAYPEAMIEDLVRSAKVSGRGRLLDLACGTGQLAFPLCQWFPEVWAVDQEPDMVDVVRAKAAAGGARNFRPIVSSRVERRDLSRRAAVLRVGRHRQRVPPA